MSKPREEKYQAILDAATEAFAEYGYFTCQVSKIAKLAGVADGTIYLYFKNKEDILVSLFSDRMGQFIEEIRHALVQYKTTRDRLLCIIRTHFRYMQENRALAIVTQIEIRQSDPKIREAISGPLREYFQLIEQVLAEGVERDEIALADIKIGRQMFFGTLDAAISDWVNSKKPRSLEGVEEIIFDLMCGAFKINHKSKI
ncbi:TetR/AcrR family transcriptional regulator [Desulfosporosinus sp. BICA1-9]|uniref:TetR/AcrR family transcriptional regulator n=1 Tax=Desulfosporosinus sp. BICA1-9 TaxID=1531958 RepID=UPI00054B16A2|nr:TetR/AcrR family transcriptional regulator [Desulfosporosinus sp. BICA1-9]KJS50416.1 MAG: transcriptional regulator [Peptococcaceae bacterium BRH_c23]KJS82250.1 MAG: transcriptional regulator [Desulfosporosinus sp. BICA1-9]KJS88990.1 MAG: transcriptional regulator [Desulfosporosinus sp. BICA1-9]HBW37982.1 TetR family transcriptional regulator [Desulfosporosinus sp.]